mgnify:CR=1 FL=1
MDWKSKLTSRKFWAAVASFVAMLVVVFGGDQSQATQITALIMAGATVVAYIVGEGLVDAAAAGSDVTIDGNAAVAPTGDVVGAANTDTTVESSTGADQASAVKQDTAAHPESGAVASDTTSAK